jgi:Tfp pilus assembly PilM family ATPase
MPQLLALEWDDAEARVAVAEVRRGSLVLEQAFAVTMTGTAPGAAGSAPGPVSASGAHDLGAVGRRIGEALTARGIKRGKTLVAVGRANIELKNLAVPPAPPDELPEMVRFQAEREFNTLADNWPLDFLPLPSDEGESQSVLAAAISPDLVAEIEVTCQSASLTPQRLILRPCAAAALLSRVRPGKENKLRLLVDLLAEEADLTVLAGDVVVFMRTTRLPSEALRTDPLRALVPEIRRTIAAVHNRFHNQRIEELFVCGDGPTQETIARDIGRELGLPTEVINPLKACTLGGELLRSLPDHPSRFAPLVGMLLNEAAPGEGIIDFLNPRRKAEAPSRRREWSLAAAAGIAVVLAIAGWIWYQITSLDEEIAALQQKSSQMGEGRNDKTATPVKKALASSDQAAEIQKWLAGDINWLDELAALSTKAPSAQDVMLTNFTTPNDPFKHTSKMHLDAVARTSDVPDQLNRALRDDAHQVTPNSFQESNEQKYPWGFKLDVQIDPTKYLVTAAPQPAKSGAKSGSAAQPAGAKADESGKGIAPTEPTATETKPDEKAKPPAEAVESKTPAAKTDDSTSEPHTT